ncbi:MAG: nickel pincer cofactor biosynthesis protein LarC, partial [Oscillospiraceae bacterium]|nr:nickel pincer cofactor biosynthesis protein LarC [Oscillospiraceae bacterium]
AIIRACGLPEKVRADALSVYEQLARAEAQAHGLAESADDASPDALGAVHFHEVGSLDALADILGVCVLVDMLGITEISASPVHVGSGAVKTQHGILPVPAPATAILLRGIPMYGGEVRGELCTPTGAALLRHFVGRFGDMAITAKKIGYGMGKKDFERANCVRAFLGEDGGASDEASDTIAELSCNLDDMTPEAVGFAVGALLEAGARDVFTTPITMKKNRPAVLLTVLCAPEDEPRFTALMFRHTTTLGVRASRLRRAILTRAIETRQTKYGEVRYKISSGYGVRREKPEYEDLSRLAKQHNLPLSSITP